MWVSREMDEKKNVKICFAASSGGHYEQLMMLKPLMEKYDSFVITEKTDYSAEAKGEKTYYMKQVNRREKDFIWRIEKLSSNIVRLESQKRSGYEQYVLGKISKEKFLKLKQDAENEIEAFRQTKAENEKELAVVQEELQQKKQIAGSTEVLLTADNLQQYVKKIEVDRRKITYTEFLL